MSRVLVAMSGGVDSSVAAALLVEQGHEVIGATMLLFCPERIGASGRSCCSLDSVREAGAVAGRLGVPHYTLDLEDRFRRDVVADFVREYARGRTPNPCARCNSFTKFGDLVAHADALGCDAVATGHYVRVRDGTLLRGRDPAKDQSYFLWGVRREVVARMLTPVGEFTKQETREAARRFGLRNAEREESQEICFVPGGDYAAVLERHLGADAPALSPGPVVTAAGEVIGEHRGFARYTIGQRRGLPGGRARPLRVVAIRPGTRELVVGEESDLASHAVTVEQVNWLADPLGVGERCEVQVRYRSKPVSAVVAAASAGQGGPAEGPGAAAGPRGAAAANGAAAGRQGATRAPADPQSLVLELDEPALAVAPGQSAVMYRGDQVLGGGVMA